MTLTYHEIVHDVYFDDLDGFRVLHNSKYLILFERTIGSFWSHLGWKGPFIGHDPDQWHMVRTNYVEYHKPIVGVGQALVRIWFEELGRTSLKIAFEFRSLDKEILFASGSRVLVRIDRETHKPTPWTEEFREKIKPYIEDS